MSIDIMKVSSRGVASQFFLLSPRKIFCQNVRGGRPHADVVNFLPKAASFLGVGGWELYAPTENFRDLQSVFWPTRVGSLRVLKTQQQARKNLARIETIEFYLSPTD